MSVQMLSFASGDQFSREMASCPNLQPVIHKAEKSHVVNLYNSSHLKTSDLTALSDLNPTALFLESEHESLTQLSDVRWT